MKRYNALLSPWLQPHQYFGYYVADFAQHRAISPMWRRIIGKILSLRHIPTTTTLMAKPDVEMHRLTVRCLDGEERMQLTFTYAPLSNPTSNDCNSPPSPRRSRLYTFNRLQNEPLSLTLERIATNVSKYANRKKRKRIPPSAPTEVAPTISATLYDIANKPTDNTVPNHIAWCDGASLRIADTTFDVRVNPPSVLSACLPSSLLAHSVAYPQLQLEFCDRTACRFTWFRTRAQDGTANDNSDWEEVGSDFYYKITNVDVGCRLKVTCQPPSGDANDCMETETTEGVVEGPANVPFEKRHKHTQQKTEPGRFRVVCYNILADLYADSDFSRTTLFSYCPPEVLDQSYRKQLLLRELLGYNADIICLQEVDKKLFEKDLGIVLEGQGFKGHLKLKAGQVSEGTATFYRESKFKLIAQHDINITETLQTDPHFTLLYEQICSNDDLKQKIIDRNTALQVSVLDPLDGTGQCLIVGTTHLYFHPEASHIRILQTSVCLTHLARVRDSYIQQGYEPCMLFCGDLNSCPGVGVHQLIVDGSVPSNHADWYSGDNNKLVGKFSVSHDLPKLTSAISPLPKYTNYTAGFNGCLDYIYIEADRLATVVTAPMPSDEEVMANVAIPSAVYPSDHLALVCDLKWTDCHTGPVVSTS